MSLNPYSGSWNLTTAGHLLRRTTYGPSKAEINEALTLGLSASLDKLFAPIADPQPPINYADTVDTNTPIGETWINSPHTRENATVQARFRSLTAWQMINIYQRRFHIQSRMMTFWHNHFPVDFLTIRDSRYLYTYWETLRANALGNFQTLVENITIDPAMLRYLDGRLSTKQKPNENYARELLELFAIGKGPIAGPGDYTNYTEEDVLEIAKIMTGWQDQGYNSNRIGTISSRFNTNRHDRTTKTLSHRFNNATVRNGEGDEYKNLISIVFQKDEVAKFIARKLYRYYVSTDIDATVESDIIEPMADLIRNDNYEIGNTLKTLLASEHFFQQLEVQGGIISNPIEFVFNIFSTIGIDVAQGTEVDQYIFWWTVHQQTNVMQMAHFAPPDVAGWPAYYLEPQFSELWVNSVTIRNRLSFIDFTLSPRGMGGRGSSTRFYLTILEFLEQLDQPEDPTKMIEEIATYFYTMGLTSEQVEFLKEILLPGLPDNVWTMEYENYLNDPTNPALRNTILNRLRELFNNLLIIPEFQVL